METPFIVYVIMILGLLLYIIPIWYLMIYLLKKYTAIDINAVEIKVAMSITSLVFSYNLFYITLKIVVIILNKYIQTLK